MSAKEYLPSDGRKWRNKVEDTSRYRNYKGAGPGIVPDGVDAGPLYERLSEPIKRASLSVAINWYGLLSEDDIEQEIWVEILESPATARDLTNADPDLLVDLLIHKANRICIKERDNYEHYSGNYRYSVNEIKEIAKQYFVRSGEEIVAEFIDFEAGFARLEEDNPTYAEAIVRRYALGEMTTGKSAYSKAHQHGVTKLTNLMNRNFKQREYEYENGPETRVPNGTRYRG